MVVAILKGYLSTVRHKRSNWVPKDCLLCQKSMHYLCTLIEKWELHLMMSSLKCQNHPEYEDFDVIGGNSKPYLGVAVARCKGQQQQNKL